MTIYVHQRVGWPVCHMLTEPRQAHERCTQSTMYIVGPVNSVFRNAVRISAATASAIIPNTSELGFNIPTQG
ncbi:hypothetical protein TX25_27205 [Pseudomonas lactis]|nr:hypothetical protein TX25_27205 [Pseudomonas lactis]